MSTIWILSASGLLPSRSKTVLLGSAVLALSMTILPLDAGAQQDQDAQRFAWFIGDWTSTEPEGNSQCVALGQFMVHCESSWTDAMGNVTEAVFVWRYDVQDQMYRAYRFYSGGYADTGVGWIDGNTLTFVYAGRQGTRLRFKAVTTGDVFRYEWHESVQGGPWQQTSTGSMTKVSHRGQ